MEGHGLKGCFGS